MYKYILYLLNNIRMLENIEKYIYTNRFNHVYLYGKINDNLVSEVSIEINHYNKTDKNKNVYIKPKAIVLHINSPGGSGNAGIALMNIVNNSRVPIIALVEGMSASAATFITVIAKYRVISPEAVMLIHQLSTGFHGKHEEIKFYIKESDKFMDMFNKFYSEHTKLSPEKLKEILQRDIFLSAEDCLKYGLVDKVLEKTSGKVISNYFNKNPEYKLPVNILKVKTNFNNLYFYGNDSTSYEQNQDYETRKIMALQYTLSFNNINSNTNIETLTSAGTTKPILLRINENEDFFDLQSALALINTILLARIPIYSFIDSPTNQNTLLYSILCYKRYIYKYAFISINFINLLDISNKHEDTVYNTKLIRKVVTKLLKNNTKLPKNILDNLFTTRFILSADECVKYGICDQVVE